MSNLHFDLIIIGAGPGGEVAAIRASQLGLKTALVEKNQHLGGTCLNVGCIPTKSLLESAKLLRKFIKAKDQGFQFERFEYNWQKILDRKNSIVTSQRKGLRFLMKKNKVECFEGHAKFLTPKEISITQNDKIEKKITANNYIIATGSEVRVPPIAQVDGKLIHTSDSIMDIEKIPDKMVIIGGGVVGLEFSCLFNAFGSQVTVIELEKNLLVHEDPEAVKELVRCLKKQGITIKTETKVESITCKENEAFVTTHDKKSETYDCVLLSIGRSPNTKNLGLENINVFKDGPFIKTNRHYQTNLEHIFAIGDVINTVALAHTASAEAIHAVEIISGLSPKVIDYETNPSAIYTFPEIASIGKTEPQLKKDGLEYKVAKFPFSPLAKAKIENETEGFIKILYGSQYKEILGAHIIGGKATELISEFVLGKVLETTIDEMAHAIHPHPTLSETIMEAAHLGVGPAIHM